MFDEFTETINVCNQSRYFTDEYCVSYGFYYKKKNDMRNAETYYKKALDINPNNENTVRNVAELLLDRGEYDSSRAMLLDLKNTNMERSWLIDNALGVLELKKSNFSVAMSYFDSAIKTKNNYGEAYKHRGEVWFFLGNLNNACMDFKKSY